MGGVHINQPLVLRIYPPRGCVAAWENESVWFVMVNDG